MERQRQYRIFSYDEPAARAQAIRRAVEDFGVAPEGVTILGTSHLADGGGSIGWLVRVLVG